MTASGAADEPDLPATPPTPGAGPGRNQVPPGGPGVPGSPGPYDVPGASGGPGDRPVPGDHDIPGGPGVPGRPGAFGRPGAPGGGAGVPYSGGAAGFLDPMDGESVDEAELRELLRQAVSDIAPAPGALDRLRHAVPARRQHRRQAVAGSAAALLLVGAAVPALVHATSGGGSVAASPVGRAGGHTSRPGEDSRVSAWGSATEPGSGGWDQDGYGQPSPTYGAADPSLPAASPGTPTPPSTPACSAGQLGKGATSTGSPDAQGRLYGWFRVANISTSTCAMPPGTGTVQIRFLSSAANASAISVVSHTAGDPATQLPDPQGPVPVVLSPGQAYKVAYAWVPAAGGPGGCPQPTSPPATATATATPTGEASGNGSTGTAAAGASGGQASTYDSAPVNTPPGGPPGGPSAATPQPADFTLVQNSTADGPVVVGPTVQDACAGTVYATAPMAQEQTEHETTG